MKLASKSVVALAFVAGLAGTNSAMAQQQCTVPNTISNGEVADATEVMGNFNAIAQRAHCCCRQRFAWQ